VTPELEGDFIALCTAAHLEASGDGGARVSPETQVASEARITVALARDDVRALLAVVDDRPVGYVVLSQRPMSFLIDSPCVSIEQIFVAQEARRSGAARALVNAAAQYADQLGAEQIASTVPAQGREANRFFARLGFSSYVVRRVTTTSALRRRLATGQESHPAVDQVLQRRRWLRAQANRSTTLDQLLLRRRSLRGRVARSGAVSHLGPAPGSGT
jgi:GNAT superfamily N-acetyltransferase